MRIKYIVAILSPVILTCFLVQHFIINPRFLDLHRKLIGDGFVEFIAYKNNQRGLYLYLVDDVATVRKLRLDTLYEGEAFKKPRDLVEIKRIITTTSPLYDASKIADKVEKLPNSNKCYLFKADSIFRFNCNWLSEDIRKKIGPIDEWKPNEIGFWKVGNNYLSFDSLLSNINNEINCIWDPPIRLDGNKNFMQLYNNPNKYYRDFIRVFEKKHYPDSEKMICVFAIQKLNFDKYLDFSTYSLDMFEKGNINEEVLIFIVFPNGWNTKLRFAEKYNDPRVHKLLQRILNDKKISNRSKISLKHIASGETWKQHISNLQKGFPE